MGGQFKHSNVNHRLSKAIGLLSEVQAIKDLVTALFFKLVQISELMSGICIWREEGFVFLSL